jgi:mRNA interferase MazF
VERGDVYAFVPPRERRGHEQSGRRYAVVVQGNELVALSTVVVVPTSTEAVSSAFRPEVELAGRRTRVLVDQVGAFDVSRFGRRVGRLAHSELREVDEALQLVLGLF